MKRALVLLSTITAYLAFSASAAPATDPRAMQLTYTQWVKFCITVECFIGIEARGQCHPSGGAVTIVLHDSKARLSAHFGTRRALVGAVSVQIDQDLPISLSEQRCFANGCFFQSAINRGVVDDLRRSQTITIEAADAAGQKLRLSFPLANFAKVLDGPATEPKVFEVTQPKLQEELRQRAENNPPPPPQCDD